MKFILIIKKNSKISNLDILKYNQQYHNLRVYYNDTYHNRYFILDKEIVYHSGASINYAGSRTFSINILDDILIKQTLNKNITNIINK